VLSKKSRRGPTEESLSDAWPSVSDVRLTILLQGNSVQIDCRRNSRNEEGYPLKSVVGITG